MHDHDPDESAFATGSGSYGGIAHEYDEDDDEYDEGGDYEVYDEQYVGSGSGGDDQPLVMDFEEMGSAMANLNVGITRGGSGSGQSRIPHPKLARVNSSGSPVVASFGKIYRSENGNKVYRTDG
jgi:hypothetical protein